MAPVTTVDEFLQPSDGAAELYHVLASTAKSSEPPEGRFSDVEGTERWKGFDISRLSTMDAIAPYLSRTCEAQLNPSIRDLARVIFDERQLECFYLKTSIARVDTALLHAIPPGEPGATIIVCPGRFDGLHNADRYEPDYILPDWIVVEGNYSPKYASSMKIEDFLNNRTILAVGDTKLVRQTKDDDENIVADTEACHKNFLAQLQYYSKTLYMRYAFVLSNKVTKVTTQCIRRRRHHRGRGRPHQRAQSLRWLTEMRPRSVFNLGSQTKAARPSALHHRPLRRTSCR